MNHQLGKSAFTVLAALCGAVALFKLQTPMAALMWGGLGVLFLYTRRARWDRSDCVVPVKVSGSQHYALINPNGNIHLMDEVISLDTSKELLSRMRKPKSPPLKGLWYKAPSTGDAVALVDRAVRACPAATSVWGPMHSVDGETDVCVTSGGSNRLTVFAGGRHDLRGFTVVDSPDALVGRMHEVQHQTTLATESVRHFIKWESWGDGVRVGCQTVASSDAVRLLASAIVWAALHKGRGTEPLLKWLKTSSKGLVMQGDYVAPYDALVVAASEALCKENAGNHGSSYNFNTLLGVKFKGRSTSLISVRAEELYDSPHGSPTRVRDLSEKPMVVGVGCQWVTEEQAISAARVALDRGSDFLPLWEQVVPPREDDSSFEFWKWPELWKWLSWTAASLPLSLMCTAGVMVATPIRRALGRPHPMEQGVGTVAWTQGLTPLGRAYAVYVDLALLAMLL